MQLDATENLHICGICNSGFMRDEELQVHSLAHNDHSHCRTCVKVSRRLRKHRKAHACKNCGKQFVLAEYLKIHIKTNYRCCKFFTRARNLKMKMKFRVADGSYCCPNCTKSFTHFHQLKKHAEVQHGGILHSCSLHGKTMVSTRGGQHVISHSLKRNYSCVRCSMRHLRAQKIRPYSCPRCPQSFSLPAELEQHLAVHYSARAYSCIKCDERFSYLGALKKHLVSHTGKKPHVCHTCGNHFSHAATLKIHLKIHAKKGSYTYSKYEKSFHVEKLHQQPAT